MKEDINLNNEKDITKEEKKKIKEEKRIEKNKIKSEKKAEKARNKEAKKNNKVKANSGNTRQRIVTSVIVIILLLAMFIPSVIGIVEAFRG